MRAHAESWLIDNLSPSLREEALSSVLSTTFGRLPMLQHALDSTIQVYDCGWEHWAGLWNCGL